MLCHFRITPNFPPYQIFWQRKIFALAMTHKIHSKRQRKKVRKSFFCNRNYEMLCQWWFTAIQNIPSTWKCVISVCHSAFIWLKVIRKHKNLSFTFETEEEICYYEMPPCSQLQIGISKGTNHIRYYSLETIDPNTSCLVLRLCHMKSLRVHSGFMQ